MVGTLACAGHTLLGPGCCNDFPIGCFEPYGGADPVGFRGMDTSVAVGGAALPLGIKFGHGWAAETDYGNGHTMCHVYNDCNKADAGDLACLGDATVMTGNLGWVLGAYAYPEAR